MDVSSDGSMPFTEADYDPYRLPDFDDDLYVEEDIAAFAKALAGPDRPSSEDGSLSFITALNDWRPVYQRARKEQHRKKRRPPRRGTDETREGLTYALLKWPLFLIVMGWIIVLGVAYVLTRAYVTAYERLVTLRGRRNELRMKMRSAFTYAQWVEAAKAMDRFLKNDTWKGQDEYAYYNSTTTRSVRDQLRRLRLSLGAISASGRHESKASEQQVAEELRSLVESSVKDNFVGTENPHLYSETYCGTKNLVQSFVDEVAASLKTLSRTDAVSHEDKSRLFEHLYTNYGRTALCLSGGGTLAYYHFGLAKALLESNALPQVITGTSGGALVAALLATRTNEELKQLLVPALAHRINACGEPPSTWVPRWWRTGARFDSVDWARRCSWFCNGSLTFREAYERTGRILNVTCIPSEPSSPTLLANYLTAPDCVVWSAVLASAAVPGILNPVVLMRKTRAGKVIPYSFGNKWKDGSLRTDIPLKALNTHFNVNFSIVSQVNPHISLFFFSSRGAVGRPVTHRRGRGWRGGFLGSAVEQYLKLDLTKWLKVLRHLELLPRYFGQDWSEVWLQRFSGTITIWPRVKFPSDFLNLLTDPTPARLARMLHVGQQVTWPKLKFIQNRMAIERGIEDGWRACNGRDRVVSISHAGMSPRVSNLSEEDLAGLLEQARRRNGSTVPDGKPALAVTTDSTDVRPKSPSLGQTLSGWLSGSPAQTKEEDTVRFVSPMDQAKKRRGSVFGEMKRQSGVFFDDDDLIEGEQDGSVTSASGSEAGDGDGEEYFDANNWNGDSYEPGKFR